MYIDEIQYTINHVNLFWFYLFIKTIYMYTWNPKPVKLKPKRIALCVCELEHINTSLSNTRSKHKLKLNKLKSSCRTPSSSQLDPNAIQWAWLQLSARCDLDARTLKSPCESFKTPLLKLITYYILIKYLKLNITRLLENNNYMINHHQN